ncbi:MAG: AI-2E family transporter, partial [bacterium]
MSNEAARGGRFRFAPILTATVLTVLGIWLFKTVAQVFVLLMLGVLLSLYLGSLAGWIERRTHAPNGVALAGAIFGSLALLALLVWSLAPPVIEQTRRLIQQMPTFIAAWETGIDNLAAKFPALRDIVGPPGEHRTVHALYEQASGFAGGIPTKIFEIVHAAINIFAVGVMGIYLALH